VLLPTLHSYLYVAGPLALLIIGILLRSLQFKDGLRNAESWFFGSELSLSAVGSVLSAATSGKFDAAKTIELIYLAVFVIIVVLVVVNLHKHFEDLTSRPRLRFLFLGVCSNLIALVALVSSLYSIKI
jgi:hypothetical protein